MALLDRAKKLASGLGEVAGSLARGVNDALNARPVAEAPTPVQGEAEDPLVKALVKENGPRGMGFDPLDAIGKVTADANMNPTHLGTDGMPWWMLDRLAAMSVPALVIHHAVSETCEFARRQVNPHTYGFRLRIDDDEREPTKAEKRRMAEIEKVIAAGGGKYQPGGFEGTLRRWMHQSCVFDAAPAEILTAGSLRFSEPTGLFIYDAETIRRRAPDPDDLEAGQWGQSGYVQWMNNRVVAEWDEDEFIYGIRNPRSTRRFVDYGHPELFMLWSVLVNFGRAENYNAVNFTSGIHSNVLLAVLSGMDPEAFASWRRNFDATFTNASAKRRLPVVGLDSNNKEDVKAINLSSTNKEMEFTEWLFYNVKLVCAAFGVDPVAALNMQFGNEGQTSALNSAGPGERYDMSRARGLRPRLRAVEAWMNSKYLPRFRNGEDFVFEFGGHDSLTEQEKLDMDIKSLANFMSVNEIRARYDLEPVEGPAGDVIANPYISSAQQMSMGAGDEQGMDDDQLMQSLGHNVIVSGDLDRLTKGSIGPVAEALRRGLVRPPPNWRPGRPWSVSGPAKQTRLYREPIVIQVAA